MENKTPVVAPQTKKRKAEDEAGQGQAKKAKKPSKPKTPKVRAPEDEPAKNKSAYIFWCTENRPKIVEKLPVYDFANTGRGCGKEWKALSKEQKAPYEALAQADKKRYEEEVRVWKLNYPRHVAAAEEHKKAKRQQKKAAAAAAAQQEGGEVAK